jgi:hypothetical protein
MQTLIAVQARSKNIFRCSTFFSQDSTHPRSPNEMGISLLSMFRRQSFARAQKDATRFSFCARFSQAKLRLSQCKKICAPSANFGASNAPSR